MQHAQLPLVRCDADSFESAGSLGTISLVTYRLWRCTLSLSSRLDINDASVLSVVSNQCMLGACRDGRGLYINCFFFFFFPFSLYSSASRVMNNLVFQFCQAVTEGIWR